MLHSLSVFWSCQFIHVREIAMWEQHGRQKEVCLTFTCSECLHSKVVSMIGLSLLGYCRNTAVQHGGLCGGRPASFVGSKGSLKANKNTMILILLYTIVNRIMNYIQFLPINPGDFANVSRFGWHTTDKQQILVQSSSVVCHLRPPGLFQTGAMSQSNQSLCECACLFPADWTMCSSLPVGDSFSLLSLLV